MGFNPTLLVFTAILMTWAGGAHSATHCPPCGNTTVPYPLSTSTTCGDQSYKIICNASTGTLVFPTLNNTYPITSITPSIQRLTIKPSTILPNTCVTADLSTQGILLNQSLPFNVTSSNTILYLNCTENLLSSPLNCTSTSLCHTYVNNTPSVSECESAPICCSFRAGGSSTSYQIRVRDSGCRAYTSFVNLDPNLPVSKWPSPSLEIQWVSPAEPVCGSQSDCDGNSTCGPDPSTVGVNRCFCDEGLWWDPIDGTCVYNVTCQDPNGCDNSTDHTALIAGLSSGLGVGLLASRMVEEEKLMDVVDPMLKEGATTLELDTIKALGFLAVGCLEERRQNRPSMKEVAEEIEYIIAIASAKVAQT
ncbi:hypothetical protein RJ641_036010 [Dillenia turbinata]|uniref:Wall-associated receptor kinase galacturonan-binding domain-containing protein n=1 Tax=Dillenia turbinata TaxID=194707 RepID=A0AAN8VP01_9MAGN